MNSVTTLLAVLSLASLAAAVANPWPAWRGDGTGVSQETDLPVAWSESENVVWRTPLPGEGNSSPIVWENRVFVTAATADGAKRLVICLDAQTGQIRWQTEILPHEKTLLYPKTGFAAPTPATDGQRVFAFFDSPGLVALDLDGKVQWQRALGPFKAPYNMGTSPVLHQDTVIQSCDHQGAAFIAAFRKSDGAECWRSPRQPSGFGHFGTPLLIRAGTGLQLAVNGEPVAAYDPDTGRELWTCRGMKVCVGPSTVFGHGLVYASSGRIGPVMGIDPSGKGDLTETHVRMNLASGGPYVPSPLIFANLLMIPGDNGKLLFYGADHQLAVQGRVPDHFSASPAAGDGKIYWSSERGKTYVIDAAALTANPPAVKVLAENELAAGSLASPAISGGRLFIRTLEALYCIGNLRSAPVARTEGAVTGSFENLRQRYDAHQAHWQNEKEAQARLETVEAIAKLDGPEVIPFLLHVAVKEPHWDICEEAAKCLAKKGPPAVDPLLTLVPDSRPFIRTIAIQELGRMKVLQAVPGLLKATRDKEPLVRSASLEALTQVGLAGAPEMTPIFDALLSGLSISESPVVRQAALEGLSALEPHAGGQRSAIIETLHAVKAGPNPGLAEKAAQLLSPTGVYGHERPR